MPNIRQVHLQAVFILVRLLVHLVEQSGMFQVFDDCRGACTKEQPFLVQREGMLEFETKKKLERTIEVQMDVSQGRPILVMLRESDLVEVIMVRRAEQENAFAVLEASEYWTSDSTSLRASGQRRRGRSKKEDGRY